VQHPTNVREPAPEERADDAERSERTFLEAGFLGLAVLNGIAGAVLLIVPLLITLSGAPFAASDYGLGLAGVFLGAVWWGLSRISRQVEPSDRTTTSHAPEERWLS